MAQFKITYQDVPYNFTQPHALVVEAASQEAALVTAYNHLTRTGHAVAVDSVEYDNRQLKLNWKVIREFGWPVDGFSGDTHIRSIAVHLCVDVGKVISE